MEELEERERQHLSILNSEFLEKKAKEAKTEYKIIDEVIAKNLREYLETEPGELPRRGASNSD